MNGILGNDFLIKYGARIDFEASTLTLENVQERTKTYLKNTSSEILSVPPRSEYITFIKTDVCSEHDYVILPNEIAKNVFIAATIVRSKKGKIPVRILNTREENVSIKQFKPVMKPLSEFLMLEKTDFDINGSQKLLLESIIESLIETSQ